MYCFAAYCFFAHWLVRSIKHNQNFVILYHLLSYKRSFYTFLGTFEDLLRSKICCALGLLRKTSCLMLLLILLSFFKSKILKALRLLLRSLVTPSRDTCFFCNGNNKHACAKHKKALPGCAAVA